MAFRKLLMVATDNFAHMRLGWGQPTECIIDHDLSRRIRQMADAANNVRDLHEVVVDYNRIVVRSESIRLNDNKIANERSIETHCALNDIFDDDLFCRRTK